MHSGTVMVFVTFVFLSPTKMKPQEEKRACRATASYCHDCFSFSQTTSGWWQWPRASPPCCFPSSGSTSMFPSCPPLSSTSWMLLFPTWWVCSPKRAPTAPNWSFLRRYTVKLCIVNSVMRLAVKIFTWGKCAFKVQKQFLIRVHNITTGSHVIELNTRRGGRSPLSRGNPCAITTPAGSPFAT